MITLLLFILGGWVGGVAIILAGLQRHQERFNTVSAGILGALFGGLYLPRALWDDGAPSATSFTLALLIAAVFTTVLQGLRRLGQWGARDR
jgi:uncharacterized membrane protein YeaQ/YmgE (transglycosylase-associated protein family)